MESTCPSCELLISQQRHHPYLVNISTLQDSQLYKCRCCNSYLHCYLQQWEIISIGYYDERQSPPTPSTDSKNRTMSFANSLALHLATNSR